MQIRASLTPSAETQQLASLWLEDYFDKYGDQAPNKNETHLQLMDKKNLFDMYIHDLTKQDPPRQTVNYSRFLVLWSVLFPTCISRA